MVALARALMASPKLLLLDEPSLGLSPLLRTDMFRVLRDDEQVQRAYLGMLAG